MSFQAFCRLLVTALVSFTFVQASPFWAMDIKNFGLGRRDVVLTGRCVDLVVGATRSPHIGTVCVDLSGDTLTITYTVTDWTFKDIHAWVGISLPPPKVPKDAPYTSGNGICSISGSVAICTIEHIPSEWRSCTGPLYIVAHTSDTTGRTAWDDGTCYDDKGNCAKYFTVTKSCQCPTEFIYSPITTSTTFSFSTITTLFYETVVNCETTPAPIFVTSSCNDPSGGTVTSSTVTNVILNCPIPIPTFTL